MKLQSKVQLGFGVGLALFGFVSVLARYSVLQSVREAAWVAHTNEALEALESVGAEIRTLESSQRGYLLTGEAAFTYDARLAARNAADRVRHLRSLIPDNPQQQARLTALRSLIESRIILAERILRSQGPAPSRAIILATTREGSRMMNQMQLSLREMKAEERDLLVQRVEKSRRSAQITQRLVLSGGLFGLGFGALALLWISRDLRLRLDAERGLERSREDLEQRVVERTAALTATSERLRAEIIQRERAEHRLRESEQRYRLASRAANDAIWDWDLGTGQVYLNEVGEALFGDWKISGLSFERWWHARVHTEDRNRALTRLKSIMEGTEEHWSQEYRFEHSDGSYAFLLDRGFILRDAHSKATRLIGSTLDMTELKRTEAALRVEQERYRLLFEESPQPIAVLDPGTLRFLAVNQASVDLYGFDRQELLSTALANCLPTREISTESDVITNLKEHHDYQGTLEIQRKDGQRLIIEIRTRAIDFGGRRALLSLLSDVTEKIRLEEKFRQAQKMEAVGQLAAGIAHDFNNLLTVILGYSFEVKRKLHPDHPLLGSLSEIEAAGHRAAGLTRQLLTFSRKQILQPKVLQLNIIVTEINRMLLRVLGEDINVALRLDPELGQMRADPTQVEQLIVNLAVNARDAMPHGGQLTIETQNAEFDARWASIQGVPPGKYVVLAVSDTGTGMDEETKTRAFDPFFTTKGAGKGTGLGLSTVMDIVQRSGGNITVYSEPGHGSAFKVYLPCIDAPAECEVPAGTLPREGKGGSILLVEDESPVRILAAEVLQESGYTVLQARNAEEALRIVQSGAEIDLLFTDVVMPDVSGPDLARRLQVLRPDLYVIYTSGYTDHALLRSGRLEKGDALFLQKPYTPKSLLNCLQTALTRRRGA